MVPPGRLELPTSGLRVRCATIAPRRVSRNLIFFYVLTQTNTGSKLTLTFSTFHVILLFKNVLYNTLLLLSTGTQNRIWTCDLSLIKRMLLNQLSYPGINGGGWENRTPINSLQSCRNPIILIPQNALRTPAVIIVYQKFRQVAPTSLFITYTLHPLPDRFRSRIANASSVGLEPPLSHELTSPSYGSY